MMRVDRLDLRYQVQLQGPLHVGSGLDRGLVDRAILRGPDGWPFIPGSAIKGLVREQCDRIAAALNLPVREPHVAGADIRHLARGPTVVELIFGSRWHPGTLGFSDALATAERTPRSLDALVFARTRVSLSRRTGAAQRQLLYTTEYVAPAVTFAGRIAGVIQWNPSDLFRDEHHPLTALLVAGLLAVDRIGGDRSVGGGHCAIRLVALRLNGALFEGEQVVAEVERLFDQLPDLPLLEEMTA